MLFGCRQGMGSAEVNCKGFVAPKKGANVGGLVLSSSRFLNTDEDWQGRTGLVHVPCSSLPFCFKAEKKKGRSATFYPLDNTPFLLPVDETQPPLFTSSMEPVGVSTEMALLSNVLAAYAFITGRSGGCCLSALPRALCRLSTEPTSQSLTAKSFL